MTVLLGMVKFDRALIIIDGIDQCAEEHRYDMTLLLRRLIDSGCNLLVSSQPQGQHAELFEKGTQVTVHATPDDIEAYVKFFMQQHASLRDVIDDTLEHEVTRVLIEKSQGL